MKRVACIADLHCGHPTGLTPEAWHFRQGGGPDRDSLADYQAESWARYVDIVAAVQPVDVLLVAGDCIDGRETGRHLVSEDRDDQCEIAKECIKLWGAEDIIMVYGTRRHTGKLEKLETSIANDLGATILSRAFVQIEDVMFKLRHKVGRSTIPHGRGTAIARAAMWNELRAARGKDPKAQVHLFAHTHYHFYVGGPDWIAMTLPSLQGATEYGQEEIDDDVDWGVAYFDVEGGSYDWNNDHIYQIEASKPEVIHL